MIGGIDEAGRGPLIGPMVIAGVSIQDQDQSRISKVIKKDSKRLSPMVREYLSWRTRNILNVVVVRIILPKEIDEWIITRHGGLNLLEVEAMGLIAQQLGEGVIFVDSPDVKPERLKTILEGRLKGKSVIISEHKADENYPIVATASIIAKVIRDREIAKLSYLYGDFGSGYPADARTIAFVEKWYKEKKSAPPFIRKSWQTVQRFENRSSV